MVVTIPQARRFVLPEGIVATEGPSLNGVCAEVGIPLDHWQRSLTSAASGKSADGSYAAESIVVSIPRQAGKTHWARAYVFAQCIKHSGTVVAWTAHHTKVAAESFNSLKTLALTEKMAPHIDKVAGARGSEEIAFRNGSRILMAAREKAGIRGFAKVRILVLDEAQILTEAAMSDMVPTLNQAWNPQTIMLGTPPRPKDPGEVFTSRRTDAIEADDDGEPADSALYLEFAADDDAETDDREQWRQANPSFPEFTPVKAMLRMRRELSEDNFRREALGIWDDKSVAEVIAQADWSDIADPESEISGPISIGVDVSPDRRSACVALAGETTDGRWLVAMREHKTGTVDWVVPFVESFKARNTVRAVAIEKASAAAALMDEMEKRRIRVTAAQAHDMAGACGLLYDGVHAGWLTHPGQPQLAYALSMARKRPLLNGGAWGWNKKTADSDITPVVAVTLALWGAKNSTVRRNPNPNPNRTPGRTSGRRVMGRR